MPWPSHGPPVSKLKPEFPWQGGAKGRHARNLSRILACTVCQRSSLSIRQLPVIALLLSPHRKQGEV